MELLSVLVIVTVLGAIALPRAYDCTASPRPTDTIGKPRAGALTNP